MVIYWYNSKRMWIQMIRGVNAEIKILSIAGAKRGDAQGQPGQQAVTYHLSIVRRISFHQPRWICRIHPLVWVNKQVRVKREWRRWPFRALIYQDSKILLICGPDTFKWRSSRQFGLPLEGFNLNAESLKGEEGAFSSTFLEKAKASGFES